MLRLCFFSFCHGAYGKATNSSNDQELIWNPTRPKIKSKLQTRRIRLKAIALILIASRGYSAVCAEKAHLPKRLRFQRDSRWSCCRAIRTRASKRAQPQRLSRIYYSRLGVKRASGFAFPTNALSTRGHVFQRTRARLRGCLRCRIAHRQFETGDR